MPNQVPPLSIGLPVYNGEKYLPGALRSLLGQDYGDFELIVSDNASTDSTEEICRDFAARDPRIRLFRNDKNIGATRNYNRVLELARSEYFKWASHDDECYPSFLRRCMEQYRTAPRDTVLVYSKAEIIDEAGNVKHMSADDIQSQSRHPWKRFTRVLWSSSFAHPLWGVMKRDALMKTRLMGIIEADHVLLGELALLGPIIEVPEVLYRMRRHSRCATEINRSARELLAWHDPSRAKDRIILPHWERVYIEYMKSVKHTSLSPMNRLLCYGAIPTVSYWRRLLRWTGPFRRRIGLRLRKDGELRREAKPTEPTQCLPV